MYTSSVPIIDKNWSKFVYISRNKLNQIKDYKCYNELISAEKWFVDELLMNCDKTQDFLILSCSNYKID